MKSDAPDKGAAVQFNRLLPEALRVSADELLADWFALSRGAATRPRVAVNFAVTADGAISLASGVSGGIGDEGDLAVFRGLRDRADAILAGSGTVAAEGYGRLIRDETRRAQREQRGLTPDPLMVMISRSGNLPLSAPIFASPEQSIAVFTSEAADRPQVEAALDVTPLAEVNAERAFDLLADQGVRSIVCEGGPQLTSALIAQDLVDDVFLTIAPKLAGGGLTGLVSGPPIDMPVELMLTSVAERNGSLFVRWSRPA